MAHLHGDRDSRAPRSTPQKSAQRLQPLSTINYSLSIIHRLFLPQHCCILADARILLNTLPLLQKLKTKHALFAHDLKLYKALVEVIKGS